MNNDSFGNMQLGVCYLHIRDPLLKWLAQLCGHIGEGWRGCWSEAEDEFSEKTVTSYLIGAQVEDGMLIGDLLQKNCMLLRFIFLLPSILFPNSFFQDLANSLEKKRFNSLRKTTAKQKPC